jgi:hypothetical protein
MKLRRALFVVAAVAMPMLACQLIVGIDDHAFTTVEREAGTVIDAAEAAEAASNICNNGFVPFIRPDAADNSLDDFAPIVFATRNATLRGKDKDGNVVGFDLDGVCTCDPTDVSEHEGGVSCTPTAQPAIVGSCDDDGGIDNALAHLLDRASQLPGVGVLDNAGTGITCGRQTIVYRLSNYNGLANDPDVAVTILVSAGIHAPHLDGGEVDGAACNVDEKAFDGGAAYPAKFDGTDVWSSTTGSPPELQSGWVTNYELVIDGRPMGGANPRLLPIPFGSRIITVGSPILVAHLVPLAADGQVLPTDAAGNIQGNGGRASSFRIENAFLTGRTGTSDLLAAVGSIRLTGGTDFCMQTNAYCLAKNMVCNAADSMKVPSGDFKGLNCDALSVVFQFDAVVAQLGGDRAPDPTTDSGCGDWKDDCFGGVKCQ